MKKLLALLLSLSLILISPAFADDMAVDGTADGSQYAEALEVLIGIGVLDPDEEIDVNAKITRADFTVQLAKLAIKDYDITGNAGKTDFIDLPYDHYAARSVEVINALCGVFNGVGGGQFAPDGIITYEQAVKLVVAVLGYGSVAESKGGYPVGYLIVANSLGLNDSLVTNSGELTWGDAMQIFYSALDAAALTMVEYQQTGGGDMIKMSSDGKTFLSKNFGIVQVKGIVTGTNASMLGSSSFMGKNMIQIDDTNYYLGDAAGLTDYLGYNVEAYVDVESDTEEIKYIRISERRNSVIQISGNDVIDFVPGCLTYTDENGNDSRADLSQSLSVIYNGRYEATYDKAMFTGDSTELTLVDNNNDGEYDVLKADRFYNLVVQAVDTSYEMLYDYYDSANNLNYSSENYRVISLNNADGSAREFSSLERWNVVSVAESVDGTVLKAIVSTKSVSGVVEEVAENSVGTKTLLIDGTYYDVDKNAERYENFSFDYDGVFYLNAYGKICAFGSEGSTSLLKYGFLESIQKQKGLSEKLEFKIYTDAGSMEVFESAEKMNVDGETTDDFDALYQFLVNADGSMQRQIVRYSLDVDGRLRVLDTPREGEQEHDSLKIITQDETGQPGYQSLQANGMYNGLSGKAMYDSDVKVFLIPEAGSDEVLFGVRDSSYFRVDDFYDVEAYAVGDSLYTSAIAVDLTSGANNQFSGAAGGESGIVQRVTKTLDILGDEVYKLTLYNTTSSTSDRQTIEIYAENDGLIEEKGVREGDVILYLLNTRGYISKNETGDDLDIIFRPETGEVMPGADEDNKQFVFYGQSEDKQAGNDIGRLGRHFVGRVLEKDEGLLKATDISDDPANPTRFELIQATWMQNKIYIYDTAAPKGAKLRAGTINDILSYDTAGESCSSFYMYSGSGQAPRGMLIVK